MSISMNYKVTSASYSSELDEITAIVQRADDDFEFEKFKIIAAFSDRVYSIADKTDQAGDAECDYMSDILAAFMSEFKRRYHALDVSCSPQDALKQPFEFFIEAE